MLSSVGGHVCCLQVVIICVVLILLVNICVVLNGDSFYCLLLPFGSKCTVVLVQKSNIMRYFIMTVETTDILETKFAT